MRNIAGVASTHTTITQEQAAKISVAEARGFIQMQAAKGRRVSARISWSATIEGQPVYMPGETLRHLVQKRVFWHYIEIAVYRRDFTMEPVQAYLAIVSPSTGRSELGSIT